MAALGWGGTLRGHVGCCLRTFRDRLWQARLSSLSLEPDDVTNSLHSPWNKGTAGRPGRSALCCSERLKGEEGGTGGGCPCPPAWKPELAHPGSHTYDVHRDTSWPGSQVRTRDGRRWSDPGNVRGALLSPAAPCQALPLFVGGGRRCLLSGLTPPLHA